MLKTRRQIRTEQDRFGGYSSRQPVMQNYSGNRFEIDDNDISEQDSYYAEIPSRPQTTDRKKTEKSSFYSTRESYERYPDTAEFVNEPVYTSRAPRKVRRDAESVMPTIRTRAVLDSDTDKAPAQNKRTKPAMSLNAKVMLAVYAAVVVVLAAIVIATGIAIGNLGSSVAAMEAELSAKSTIVTEQNATLSAMENDSAILGQATEIGMVKPTVKTEIELLPMGEAVNYEARTNWFDKFCDWLSNLIGG